MKAVNFKCNVEFVGSKKFVVAAILVGAKTYVSFYIAVEYSGNTGLFTYTFDINVEENTYYQIKRKED